MAVKVVFYPEKQNRPKMFENEVLRRIFGPRSRTVELELEGILGGVGVGKNVLTLTPTSI
jgi:hypothetical protein